MSRVGKQPIPLPNGVTVTVTGDDVTVKGPKGTLQRKVPPDMILFQEDNVLTVQRPSDEARHRALHGLTRALMFNMVEGVTNGFRKEMDILGVGYRAQVNGTTLVMQLGYSHPIEVDPPAGISFEVTGNRLAVIGIDKEQVGQVAAELRNWRKPEPYKGKGLRYINEQVYRKAGKSTAKGGR